MTMMDIIKILKTYYFGGKGNGLGKKLITYFPDNYKELNYLEPFGGSAAVLFTKDISPIEWYWWSDNTNQEESNY